jgi:sorbitol/mannitol transport system permease protein
VSTAAAPQPAVTAGAQEEGSQPSLVLPLLQFPSVAVLFLWMIVPLGMTIYFSFIRKNLLNPELSGFAGLENYRFLWEDPAFIPAIINSIILIGAVLIAPFFVMPTVSALIWKNMFAHDREKARERFRLHLRVKIQRREALCGLDDQSQHRMKEHLGGAVAAR